MAAVGPLTLSTRLLCTTVAFASYAALVAFSILTTMLGYVTRHRTVTLEHTVVVSAVGSPIIGLAPLLIELSFIWYRDYDFLAGSRYFFTGPQRYLRWFIPFVLLACFNLVANLIGVSILGHSPDSITDGGIGGTIIAFVAYLGGVSFDIIEYRRRPPPPPATADTGDDTERTGSNQTGATGNETGATGNNTGATGNQTGAAGNHNLATGIQTGATGDTAASDTVGGSRFIYNPGVGLQDQPVASGSSVQTENLGRSEQSEGDEHSRDEDEHDPDSFPMQTLKRVEARV